jgi:glycosyltransferase involved in cell wall biosynthesis
VDGVTGIAIAPGAAGELAEAIVRLAGDRAATKRMGEAARQMAERNFVVERNAGRLLEVYRDICASTG